MNSNRRAALLPVLLLLAGAAHAATWLETKAELEGLVEAQEFEAAAALGPELLDSARDTFGELGPQLAETHILIADAYHQVGNWLEAESNFSAAIEILMQTVDTFAIELIAPYTGLGETYLEAGEYELAISAFDAARTIGRREFGLVHVEQIAILERMSQAASAMRDYERAREYELNIADITGRYYGVDSVEYLDASFRVAEWLSDRTAFEEEARTVYHDIQQIIDDYFEADPKLTIKRLRLEAENLGEVRRVERNTAHSLNLSEALKIVRDLDPPDPRLHAEILLDLGDFYLVRRSFSEFADEHYLEAWQLLGNVDGGEQLRQDWFSELVVVYSRSLDSEHVTRDTGAPDGFVTLEFTLDIFGQADNIRVVEADPPGLVDADAIRQISAMRFRPRVINGALIPSTGTYTSRFRYQPPDAGNPDEGAPPAE